MQNDLIMQWGLRQTPDILRPSQDRWHEKKPDALILFRSIEHARNDALRYAVQ